MSESLVLRVKRLISGSVNGVVDALETANAEMVMREAVREIERATDDVREELARTMTARHQTNRLLEHTKAKLVELTAKTAELEGYVAGLAARKREMEKDIAAFVAASEAAVGAAGSAGP